MIAIEEKIEICGDGIAAKELSNEEVIEKSLQWVNTIREEYNLPPREVLPAGRRFNIFGCPLVNALDIASYLLPNFHGIIGHHGIIGANGYRFTHDGEEILIKLPAVVKEFILRFDHGDLPEFEATEGLSIFCS